MLSKLHIALVTAAFSLVFPANGSPETDHPKGLTADERQIVDTVSTLLVAARTDDIPKLDSVITSGFYIFDGGVRFNGQALMALVRAQHAAGKRYDWNVTEPDVHITGDAAWIAYVNKGSITDASGTTNQQWLESAFLQRQGGIWRIVFMHSTRIPQPAQETTASSVLTQSLKTGRHAIHERTHNIGLRAGIDYHAS